MCVTTQVYFHDIVFVCAELTDDLSFIVCLHMAWNYSLVRVVFFTIPFVRAFCSVCSVILSMDDLEFLSCI